MDGAPPVESIDSQDDHHHKHHHHHTYIKNGHREQNKVRRHSKSSVVTASIVSEIATSDGDFSLADFILKTSHAASPSKVHPSPAAANADVDGGGKRARTRRRSLNDIGEARTPSASASVVAALPAELLTHHRHHRHHPMADHSGFECAEVLSPRALDDLSALGLSDDKLTTVPSKPVRPTSPQIHIREREILTGYKPIARSIGLPQTVGLTVKHKSDHRRMSL